MRLKQYLMGEKYVGRVKNHWDEKKTSYEIFVNPTFKEMREAGGKDRRIRFMADDITEKLYVWNYHLIHAEVDKKLKLEYYKKLSGEAEFKGGKWIMHNADAIGSLYREGNIKGYGWVNKWIKVDNYINKFIEG